VDKFPSSSDAPLDATAAVYVHKLNRIYIFGGLKDESGTFVYFDDIWYIDLPPNQPSLPLPPPLLNCSNLPSAISYPHPTDQASFIICRNATDYEVFTCPRTLLFDIKFRTCNAAEFVLPNQPCFGKSGAHPYLGDTTKFIVCQQSWSPLVGVFDCPKPLQFYPDTRVCGLRK
jgi:hypothetical protein